MKKILISILISVFIISMATIVNAATGSLSLTASSDTVIKGNTFTVTLAGTAEENITGLESTLSYDATKLSIESKSAGTNFTDASGSDSKVDILLSTGSAEKSGTLYTITFKVLDIAEEGDTTISVSNAKLALVNDSSIQEDIDVADASATVSITTDSTAAGNEENNDNMVTGSDDNKENVIINEATAKKATDKKTSLPQTGVSITTSVAIIVLGIVSVVSYISYRKYKNV